MISSLNSTTSSTGTTASANSATDPTAAQDRFLKLLVAQLTNQDPMNPMDNAQMTSQIAQINTVTGIQQLNNTVKSMAEQFASLQVLQGSSLVGRTVLVEGSTLYREGTTTVAKGTFDLPTSATSVKVEVLTPGGQLLGTVTMGARDEGRQSFEFDAGAYTGGLQYRVVAVNGKDTVEATALMRDKVVSAGAENGQLSLQLDKGGTVAYANIKAII
ncbi:MAG TPA: flagellar hook capping FlgD N-terminal domain-containing protein [Burkholderiaceae bacterium]|nr:flagellar hook capping FlgD N-terminal domain-containing protein [Burkholderiaceae bacterium]